MKVCKPESKRQKLGKEDQLEDDNLNLVCLIRQVNLQILQLTFKCHCFAKFIIFVYDNLFSSMSLKKITPAKTTNFNNNEEIVEIISPSTKMFKCYSIVVELQRISSR